MKKLLAVAVFLYAGWWMGENALAQTTPAAPPPAFTASRALSFPALPPSKPCNLTDMVGKWRLVQVFEEPQGAQTAAFSYEPFQYVSFTQEQTYKYYKSAQKELSDPDIYAALDRYEGDGLTQFTLGDAGVVYFYNEGIAVDTQVCFIVSSPRGVFKPGQMIIMPPAPTEANASFVRIAKLYEIFDGAASKEAKKADKKNDKKANSNKKDQAAKSNKSRNTAKGKANNNKNTQRRHKGKR